MNYIKVFALFKKRLLKVELRHSQDRLGSGILAAMERLSDASPRLQ